MINDDSDRIKSSLNILVLFNEDKNNSEKFMVIDVIVAFSENKSVKEVSTRMKVTICISLKKNDANSKKRGISHDRKWLSDIRNSEDMAGSESSFCYSWSE